MKKLRAIFMGTPDFAVPCLKVLHERHEVVAVVTQPDRPKGRGQKLKASPVKEFARAAGLAVLQPPRIKTPEAEAALRALRPDVIVVVAFGQILSKEILAIAPLGCINVHASLLPEYRGAAPIHWSIMHGREITGVTTMFMDAGLDTGDMILRREKEISPEITTGELHDELMLMGADVLAETLSLLAAGEAPRVPQNHEQSSYAPLLKKEIEKIDWSQPAKRIHDQIRGLNPWPGAYCLWDGDIVKIWKTRVVSGEVSAGAPGGIARMTDEGFCVITGDGTLEVLALQPAGKRKMAAKDFVCGRGVKVNDRFD